MQNKVTQENTTFSATLSHLCVCFI